MARVQQTDLTSIQKEPDFIRFCGQVVKSIQSALSGGLNFSDNFASQTVKVTFGSANTNRAIAHNLAKTGVNYIVVSKSAACDIFRGSGDTSKQIVLQSTVANVNVTLVLF